MANTNSSGLGFNKNTRDEDITAKVRNWIENNAYHINIHDNPLFFEYIRNISSEEVTVETFRDLSDLFNLIRLLGKRIIYLPGWQEEIKQIIQEDEVDTQLGYGFLRKNGGLKALEAYLQDDLRRNFIQNILRTKKTFFNHHFSNILFLYGYPSDILITFLKDFSGDAGIEYYQGLFTVDGIIKPGPLGTIMIGKNIFMGINKDPSSQEYIIIKKNIKTRIKEMGGIYNGYNIIFFNNIHYWESNKRVPFKRINKNKMACNNGSTCIEPILFDFMLSNEYITPEQLEQRKGYSYTCLWVGDPKPSEESDYTIGTQGGKKDVDGMSKTGYYERIYERLFTEYCLDNEMLTGRTLLTCHDIVYNLMLACPGCQMNYYQNINGGPQTKWDNTYCEDKNPVVVSEYLKQGLDIKQPKIIDLDAREEQRSRLSRQAKK
jgi:hypothetical protein